MDFLKDLLSDVRRGSGGERAFALLTLTMLAVLVGCIGLLTFALIDSYGINPTKICTTAIEEKTFVPAHTTLQMVQAGKVMVPVNHYHPDAYKLSVRIQGQLVELEVPKETYDRFAEGQLVDVRYGYGRLTGKPIPAKIEIVAEVERD